MVQAVLEKRAEYQAHSSTPTQLSVGVVRTCSVRLITAHPAQGFRFSPASIQSALSRSRSRSFFHVPLAHGPVDPFQLSPAPLAREPAVRAEQEWPVHARWMRGVRERLLLTKEHLMISGASEKMLEK